VPRLAQSADGLDPTKDLFHPFPLALTDRVPFVAFARRSHWIGEHVRAVQHVASPLLPSAEFQEFQEFR
jgi:hypothetical protein